MSPELTLIAPPAALPVQAGASDPARAQATRQALKADARRVYVRVLTWAFTLLNSVRVLSYLPTLWAIYTSGDSSQHSLVTWCTWLGANLTMAAWLYENNGSKVNRAVAVNLVNSTMCSATIVLIACQRI